MSINAYRVIKHVYEKQPSFSYGDDWEKLDSIMQPIESHDFEIDVEELREFLLKEKITDEVRERLEADLKWADDNGDTVIEYHEY